MSCASPKERSFEDNLLTYPLLGTNAAPGENEWLDFDLDSGFLEHEGKNGGLVRAHDEQVWLDSSPQTKVTKETHYKDIHGVTWDRAARKFRAKIKVKKKTWYLGLYESLMQAASAWDDAYYYINGDVSGLNYPWRTPGKPQRDFPPGIEEARKRRRKDHTPSSREAEQVEQDSVHSPGGSSSHGRLCL